MMKNLIINEKKILELRMALSILEAAEHSPVTHLVEHNVAEMPPLTKFEGELYGVFEQDEINQVPKEDKQDQQVRYYTYVEPVTDYPKKTVIGTLSGRIARFLDVHVMPKIFEDYPTQAIQTESEVITEAGRRK